tara:strand:+ start:11326 stop:11529 length:204 start_codon:yes stop_codon:yes gene_type:complete
MIFFVKIDRNSTTRLGQILGVRAKINIFKSLALSKDIQGGLEAEYGRAVLSPARPAPRLRRLKALDE